MRLGGMVFGAQDTPEAWIETVKKAGFRAAYCPLEIDADDAAIKAYSAAAEKADIVIAEVGTWSNPISPDDSVAKAAVARSIKGLELADKIGAACCVNIAGSRVPPPKDADTAEPIHPGWDGPHPDNFSADTFDMIVESVREIIDAVKPTRAYYTLETMPWVPPDSADSYLELIKAVDRERFAVHYDPVNTIVNPRMFFETGAVIKDFCKKLGPYIKSCHAKDSNLSGPYTLVLAEGRPGTGSFDYRTYLTELNKLDPGLPVMLEHMEQEEDYRLAAGYVRETAAEIGIAL